MQKDNSYIKKFKIRNFLPFYIEKVDNKFFSGTSTNINKHNSVKSKNKKMIAKLDPEESVKFFDSQGIVDHNNIKYLLNQIIWKLVAKTGNKIYDLFSTVETTSWGQPLFLFEKFEFEDLKIIGNTLAEKRYIYCLNIDPQSYLYNFIEQIEIAFVIDEKKKNISGGFFLNSGQFLQLDSFDEIIEKFYYNSMIKSFIHKELSPISVSNILSLMDLYTEDDFLKLKNKKNKNINKSKSVNKKSLDELKKSWNEYLKEKVFNSQNPNLLKKKKYLENDLFYGFLNVMLCCLAIYEELKTYFSNSEPELYLPLLKKIEFVKINDDQNSEQDFYELIYLIKNRFFHFGKEKMKNIKNPEDALEALIKFDKFENESFGSISTIFELNRNINAPFLNDYEDIFVNSKDLKILFLLAFDSDILGINLLSADFLNYDAFNKNIKSINFDSSWNNLIKELVYKNICEWNYNYVTFVDASFSGLIIKNSNSDIKDKDLMNLQMEEDGIFNNYLWSFIYGKTLIWRLQNIEEDVQIAKIEKPWELRNYLQELEILRLSNMDEYYGIQQVKNIVNKIDSFYEFNKLNDFLKEKITKDDKLFGKGKERRNLAATFVSATIFGILDFFTCVFSILTVTQAELQEVNSTNLIVILVGSVFAIILFLILSYIIFIPFIFRKKKKNQFY
ncbi:hypothetical protein D8X55_02870 [Malacoplasma penetrans]|nr:hypothetical protein [Malacoplasma penetrans]RXY96687.1 hypothetical protein D8X55_02870 [Malacoplasma penetrans]